MNSGNQGLDLSQMDKLDKPRTIPPTTDPVFSDYADVDADSAE